MTSRYCGVFVKTPGTMLLTTVPMYLHLLLDDATQNPALMTSDVTRVADPATAVALFQDIELSVGKLACPPAPS